MICSKFQKIFILVILTFSFISFSCATTSKKSTEDNDVVTSQENSDNTTDEISGKDLKKLDSEISSELNELTDSDNSESDTTLSEDQKNTKNESTDTENSDKLSEDSEADSTQKIEDELEEIIEPEVIELEPPEEYTEATTEISTDVSTEDEVLEVISEEDLIAPDLEEYEQAEIKQTEDTESSDSDKQEIENSEELNTVEKTEDIDSKENTQENSDADILTETENETEKEEQETEAKQEIIISRSVTLKKLEYLDVTYPGKGWIFMGLTDNSKDMNYFGRKVGSDDTKFSLQAKNAGTKILHFYKNDPVTNEYIDDYFEVIILNEKGSNKTRINAPKYIPLIKTKATPKSSEEKTEKSDTSNSVESSESTKSEDKVLESNKIEENLSGSKKQETELKTETKTEQKPELKPEQKTTAKTVQKKETPVASSKSKKAESVNYDDDEVITIGDEDDSSSSNTSDSEIIPDVNKIYDEAMTSLNSLNFKDAEQKLLLGLQYTSTGKDKFLFQLGQLYEKDSEIQNITKAIEQYTLLINNYPASSYWDKANKRIIYLKRFYMEGR